MGDMLSQAEIDALLNGTSNYSASDVNDDNSDNVKEEIVYEKDYDGDIEWILQVQTNLSNTPFDSYCEIEKLVYITLRSMYRVTCIKGSSYHSRYDYELSQEHF